jgi:ParB-like chromosome segregation protein Spo0J
MQIKSEKIVIEPIEKITPDPKNENQHSEKQIEALARIIKINGFRSPLVVSKRSGYVVVGHCRLEASRLLGMKELPVIYQDFENEADELRHRIADNEVARHATLDTDKMLGNLNDLDIDLIEFDFSELGLIDFNFNIEPAEIKNTSAELDVDSFDNFQHQCPKCGFQWDDSGKDNS